MMKLLSAIITIFLPGLCSSLKLFPWQHTATVRSSLKVMQPLKVTVVSEPFISGKVFQKRNYPSFSEVRNVIPPACFEKDTLKSMSFALLDVLGPSICLIFGLKVLLPLFGGITASTTSVLVWGTYAIISGTVAMGMWVTAHECGHGAFSNNKLLQDFVGYLFHTILLVPYYSWQRSHAVHHAYTNHIVDGETHVPPVRAEGSGVSDKSKLQSLVGSQIGNALFGFAELVKHLVFGWPAYLLFGVTGGPSRGLTNHFIPVSIGLQNPSRELFPQRLHNKVWLSDAGIVGMLSLLAVAASKFGLGTVAALYGGPLAVVNAWLVLYTWLQHTDVDVPHLSNEGYSFVKGAFHTIDRPYDNLLGGAIDFLHHRIGSTHVVHHLDCTIPHYHARTASAAIKQAFPDQYLYDPTPIFQALWRVASKCYVVEKMRTVEGEEVYLFSE